MIWNCCCRSDGVDCGEKGFTTESTEDSEMKSGLVHVQEPSFSPVLGGEGRDEGLHAVGVQRPGTSITQATPNPSLSVPSVFSVVNLPSRLLHEPRGQSRIITPP